MKNTLIKVLSFLMALTMIVGVFSAITVSAAECDHTKGEQVGEPVPATCASIGYTLYTCAKCGTIYPDDVVPMSKEHTGVVEVPASDATCFRPAMTAYSYCEDCMVDADGNPVDYIEEPEFVEGSKVIKHNFVGADNGKSTCELATVYTCTICKLTAEEAHNYARYWAKHYEKIGYIEVNDDDYLPYYAEVKGTGHEWDYVVKTAPQTCVDGVMAGECSECGATKEVAITATHKFDKPFLSCEEYVGYKCSLCGVAAPNVTPNYYPEHNLALTPTRAVNSTLEAMGYTKETLYKAPTCTDEGYAVYQCLDCKAYIQETIDALGHDFSGELLFKPNEGTYPCGGAANVGGTYYYACKNYAATGCEEVLVLDTKADKGHLLKTTVVDPTCTEEGYTLVECLVCDYEKRSNYTAIIEHSLGEYIYEFDGDVTVDTPHAANYVRYQKCADCTYTTTPEIIIAKTADGGHVMNTAYTWAPATCREKAYAVYTCKVAGCKYFTVYDNDTTTDGIQKLETGNYDKTNHGDEEDLLDLNVYEKATCVKAGWKKMYCENCHVEVTVTIPVIEHKYGSTYDANGNGKFTDAGDKNWVEVKATCLTTGKTAGICCTGCGLTKLAPQITPIDGTNHKDSTGKVVTGVVTKTVGANCQNFGYETKYYSCCNKYITVYVETGTIDENVHINTTKHDYVAPTCGNVGSHAYEICSDCGNIEILDTCTCGLADHSTLETPVIRAGEHNWAIDFGKYESCDEIGWSAHYYCTKCPATIGKTIIPAHGKQYQTKITAVDPTCTTVGYRSSGDQKVCTKCEIEYVVDSEWVIPAIGHKDENGVSTYVATPVTDDDCTTASGVVYTCTLCGHTKSAAADYVAAPNTEHAYNAAWEKLEVKSDNKIYLNGKLFTNENGLFVGVTPRATGFYSCELPTFEYRVCTHTGCTETVTQNYAPAINHFTTVAGSKQDILLDCKNIANYVGYTCDQCGLSVTTALEQITHKGAYAQKDATCTEDGYELYVCADCGIFLPDEHGDIINTVEKAFGHNPYDVGYYNEDLDEFVWGILDGKADNIEVDNPIANAIYAVNGSVEYVVESKKPTASEDGFVTYRCKTCEEVVTVVIPAIKGLGFTVTTDDVLVNGTTVTVKIAVDANKFEFNSFKINLNYDVYALEYVGAKLVYDGFAAADAVTLVANANSYYDIDDIEYGYVTMSVYVPNGIDGEPKNVELTADGAAFIEVTFNVRATAHAFESAIIDASSYAYKIIDEEGEPVDINGVNDEIEAELDEETFVVNFAGDVNGDVYIDQGDAVAIMSAIYASEYSAAADLNKDGVVDLLDLGAVLQFTVSKGDMLAYLEMTGVSIDDVVAGYKLRYDLNGDGNINDTDKALLADSLVEAIEELEVPYYAMSYVLYFADANSLEELVAHAAKQLVNGDEIFVIVS